MTQLDHANIVRNPDARAYRLLIDKNLAPSLAAALSGDPVACRMILGALTPGPVAARLSGSRRRG